MISYRSLLIYTASGIILALYWYCLPSPLFKDPCSTVILDHHGELLGSGIANDGQWRFPESDNVPDKYKKALLFYEDKYFYRHPGVNPLSLLKALGRNLKAGKIVSGGSTISMQVIRLSRKDRPRTLCQKIIEIALAIRLEVSYSKEDIILLYSAHAPYGGNVVGLEAAAWRYFGRNSSSLSWAESALLAVLPNSPSLMHPGRNREALLKKRNRLLDKLYKEEIFDETTYRLSVTEPLPDKPYPLPRLASHLLDRFIYEHIQSRILTSIDKSLQESVEQVMKNQTERLYSNEIHNAACLVVDVHKSEVLAYYGNIRNNDHPEYGGDVDIITSSRSSGSILKPFLYAEMIQRGEILPGTLIADIPTFYGNFSPKNNTRGYDGVVPAKMALSRSLNIPAVRMLKQYGTARFYDDLTKLGISTLDHPSDHYGLSLILGGAESTLWDLASIYSGLARTLNRYNEMAGLYDKEDFKSPQIILKTTESKAIATGQEQGLLGAGAIYLTFKALLEVNRPEQESGWENFATTRKIAWKTGTSFGFRDGWAIGITPEYVVAIWTGNANGEGRPGITGLQGAAPILFEVFNLLPQTSWFKVPYDDLKYVKVCSKSGHLAGQWCSETDSVLVPPAGIQTTVCPYHRLIHLDQERKYRVNSNCYSADKIIHESWFILPPVQEWYYRQKNAWYKSLPLYKKGCEDKNEVPQMQMLYPEANTIVYVPLELDGSRGRLVCEAIHRKPGIEVFWHIDNQYLGKTKGRHQIAIIPEKGRHTIYLIDSEGEKISSEFEAIERSEK